MSGTQDPFIKHIKLDKVINTNQICKDLSRSEPGFIMINGVDLLDIVIGTQRFEAARKPITNASGQSSKPETMVEGVLGALVSTIYNSLNLSAFPDATEESFHDFFTKHFHQGGFRNSSSASLTSAAIKAGFAYLPDAKTGSETCTLESIDNKLISTSIVKQPSTALRLLTNIEQSPFSKEPTKIMIAITHEISWNDKDKKWDYDLVVVNHDSASACLIQGLLYQSLDKAIEQYRTENPDYIEKQSYVAAHSLISNPLKIVSPGQAIAFILGQSGNRTTDTSLRILFLNELAKSNIVTLPKGGIKNEKDVITAVKSLVATYAGDNTNSIRLIEACAHKLKRPFRAGNFLPTGHADLMSTIGEVDALVSAPRIKASNLNIIKEVKEDEPVSFRSSISARTTSASSPPAGSFTFFPAAPVAPVGPSAGAGSEARPSSPDPS